MNCPACGQLAPMRKLDDTLYFENHVEISTARPYWTDESATLATFTASTRLCPASGREVDTQT